MEATLDASAFDLLRARKAAKRRPGSIYLNGQSKALMDMPVGAEPVIDEGQMSCSAIISTPTPDRSEDVVLPVGCMLDNYRKNPVVYFDHGFSGLALPIAKSEDADGNLSVVINDDSVEATSYFSQSMYEAHQIFQLICEKIVRATSIHFEPLRAKVRDISAGYRPALLVEEWDLLEWSWVGIPDNPEAVAKLLERNKLAGRPICEPIRKSLLPFAPAKKVLGKGLELPKERTVAKKIAKAADDEKPDDEKPEDEKPADEVPADEVPADEPETEEDPADEAETDPSETPLGATVMSAALSSLATVADQIEMATGPMENPTVKEHLLGLVDTLRGQCDESASVYDSAYPDFKREESEETDVDAEAVAKFLASSQRHRMKFAGLASKLSRIATAKTLTKSDRDSLARIAGQISGVVKSAKALPAVIPPAAPSVVDQAAIDAIGEITKTYAKVNEALAAAMPHKRAH